jgi:hypothetical protein
LVKPSANGSWVKWLKPTSALQLCVSGGLNG